jgi:glycosyltransferase involved in cell wall biosynthesis
VYIEAWAVGKAVLGANSGAVTSVISHGVDGLLVAPERVGDLAIKILQSYRDKELRQRLAAAGYLKAATRYTVESVTDVIEGAYLRTLRWRNNARRQQVQRR